MQDVHEIEDNLRVIRRLMERGQRYEAITGRGALLGGVAALGVAALVHWIWRSDPFGSGAARSYAFHVAWLLLALLCAAWIVRAAMKLPAGTDDASSRRGSSAARAVLRAVLPAYVAAAALTVGSLGRQDDSLPGTWMCLHGAAILATSYHAPRRLVALGWMFLGLGSALLTLSRVAPALEPNYGMALGFGGLNIGYGLYSLLRPLPAEE